jgi:hypothetical protein
MKFGRVTRLMVLTLALLAAPLAAEAQVGLLAATAVPQPVLPAARIEPLSDPRFLIVPSVSDNPATVAQTGSSRAGGPPVYSGTSGPVSWEVSAIEQNRSADGTVIQWDFELVLREREGVGISFYTLVSDSEGPQTRTSAYRSPFARRLEPRGELRYQDFYWIQFGPGMTSGFGEIPGGRAGVRLLRRFEGRDDAGKTVRVDVRFTLDPAIGDRPRVVVETTPPAGSRALKAEELASLAGTWTGYRLRRGMTIAFEVQVRPDGQFDGVAGTVVKQRFQGNFAISQNGELEYATRNVSGRLTIHEDGPQRVLVVAAAPKVGASSSVAPYSFWVRSSGISPTVAPPVATATAPTVTPSVLPTPGAAEVLTNESILSMVKAGLDEAVILAKITTTLAHFDKRTETLVELKRAGVPDRVLAAMIGKK